MTLHQIISQFVITINHGYSTQDYHIDLLDYINK